jgi:hypothetical protein
VLLFAGFLGAAEGSRAAPPRPAAPGPPFLTLPGGVADAAGKTGYLANPGGGIDAVSLENGARLWASKDASFPLALLGKKLVAQAFVAGKADRIRVVVLDVKNKGKRLLASDPVVFPEWVSVRVTHGRSFTAGALVVENDLLLRWEARAWYAGGARPTPQVERAARKHATGVAKISLESGRVEMLKKDPLPKVAGSRLPKGLEKITSEKYWTGLAWETQPLILGPRVTALKVDNAGGKATLKLRAWDARTGKPQPDVVLLEGKSLWPQVSPDRRFVFVHQAVSRESLPRGDYAWWVFSLETGKQVAKLPFEPGMTELTVIGSRLYYAIDVQKRDPRSPAVTRTRFLRVADLKTGKVFWEREVWSPPVLLPLP